MSENMMFEDFRTKLNYEVNLANKIGKRDEQQDTVYLAVSDNEVLAVLCDGMGSLKNGRLASITAARSFVENCGMTANSSDTWMIDALTVTDEIVSQMNADGLEPEAGTTLVAVYIMDNYLQWVSAGDSRLYIFRDKQLLQITNDHNYFYELNKKLETGEISPEEYSLEQQFGEQLVSFVGMGGLTLIDNSNIPVPLRKNDIILLCSDGVYKAFDNFEMEELFNAGENAEEIGKSIVEIIVRKDKRFQDNYTFALIRVV